MSATTKQRTLGPLVVTATVGVVLWVIASVVTGKREPCDSPAYWVVVYPAAILACAFLGYVYPERPWRRALVLFEAQFLAMAVRNGELGNLWPLGMALFAVIALPGVLAATLSSRFAARAGGTE